MRNFLNDLNARKLMSDNFSPNFRFKICQKFKINQSKVINCHVFGNFHLANFKFLTDFKFKTRSEIRHKILISKEQTFANYF
jgi:hypothetical protein